MVSLIKVFWKGYPVYQSQASFVDQHAQGLIAELCV